jgi:hypothetical protein
MTDPIDAADDARKAAKDGMDQVHPSHAGHGHGGAYARAAALAAGDPDWVNATGGKADQS